VTATLVHEPERPAAWPAAREVLVFSRRPRAADEKRILEFVGEAESFCDTAVSLANRLKVDLRTARAVLDRMVGSGALRRRVYVDIETVYFRYRTLEERKLGA
jgi:hypothetical protein